MTLFVIIDGQKGYLARYDDEQREMAAAVLAQFACKSCQRQHKRGLDTPNGCRIQQLEITPTALIVVEYDYRCTDCEWTSIESGEQPGPGYECSYCSIQFGRYDSSSNRCPDCQKFSTKVLDLACPKCGAAVEGVPVPRP